MPCSGITATIAARVVPERLDNAPERRAPQGCAEPCRNGAMRLRDEMRKSNTNDVAKTTKHVRAMC